MEVLIFVPEYRKEKLWLLISRKIKFSHLMSSVLENSASQYELFWLLLCNSMVCTKKCQFLLNVILHNPRLLHFCKIMKNRSWNYLDNKIQEFYASFWYSVPNLKVPFKNLAIFHRIWNFWEYEMLKFTLGNNFEQQIMQNHTLF